MFETASRDAKIARPEKKTEKWKTKSMEHRISNNSLSTGI